MTAALLSSAFTTPEIEAAIGDRAWLQGMLDFEAALASALAGVGTIPESGAEAIRRACVAEHFDPGALGASTAADGNPAIPVIRRLTDLVDEPARGYVHWGATSQDVIDTATMIVVRDGIAVIDEDLERIEQQSAALAERHRDTVMAGRTLLQQALPITFGLKAAGWHAQVARARDELARARSECPTVQLGGAVGTLASLGADGERVLGDVARRLSLNEPDMPWHTARDRVVRIHAALGLVAGAMGRIGADIALLMQTEVGEYAEAYAGGSSTMPHKRNPVASTLALAAAQRVSTLMSGAFASLVQQHERAVGPWHSEWETLFDCLRLTAAAARHIGKATDDPQVNETRMSENLSRSRGVTMAESAMMLLARHLGRAHAHDILTEASQRALAESRPLSEILIDDPRVSTHLGPEDIHAALAPENYLGTTDRFIDRALRQR